MTAKEAMLILVRTEMKPFGKEDYYGFAGVSSDEPMIGEWFNYLVILDGDQLEITDTAGADQEGYNYENKTFQFTLKAE